MKEINYADDVLDVRDIIERFEELESAFNDAMENVPDSERGNMENENWKEWLESDESDEFSLLTSLLDELKGNGGDEQWRGDWYPITLINDYYFEDYTEELITDCGYISRDFPSWIKIDWKETSENVKVDYQTVEINDVTFWYR